MPSFLSGRYAAVKVRKKFYVTKVVARELSPKNKTYLNGRAFDDICPQHMNAGDVIRLGDEDFVFEVDSRA